MKMVDIWVVRIYITEDSKQQENLLKYLKDDAKVRGVSIFRAVYGFGDSKSAHSSSLIDLSLNLPLVIEFFDEVSKVNTIIEHLSVSIKPEHLICWPAKANILTE
jgi:PII-like signaling protein